MIHRHLRECLRIRRMKLEHGKVIEMRAALLLHLHVAADESNG
ncbi:MAG: hypothetical protein ABGY15_10485 [bacterium]